MQFHRPKKIDKTNCFESPRSNAHQKQCTPMDGALENRGKLKLNLMPTI